MTSSILVQATYMLHYQERKTLMLLKKKTNTKQILNQKIITLWVMGAKPFSGSIVDSVQNSWRLGG